MAFLQTDPANSEGYFFKMGYDFGYFVGQNADLILVVAGIILLLFAIWTFRKRRRA